MSDTLAEKQAAMRERFTLATPSPLLPQEETPVAVPRLAWLPDWAPRNIGDRPDVRVIIFRHAEECNYKKKRKDGSFDQRCQCAKYLYVKRERVRIPTGTTDWGDAETRKLEYADSRDRTKQRDIQRAEEWDALHHFERTTIAGGLERFITSLTNSSTVKGAVVIGKFNTIKDQLTAFLDEHNAKLPAPQRILHFDQITTRFLESDWRPTWPTKTYSSKTQRRGLVIRLFHHAMKSHWMADTRKISPDGGCECIACAMMEVTGASDVQPKVPFNQNVKAHGGDRHWQTKAILRACLTGFAPPRRPNAGRRLATFIQVMNSTGPRISDAALMARREITDTVQNGVTNSVWSFQPLKTRRTSKAWVYANIPPNVRQLLAELPPNISGNGLAKTHPDYFFWSGESTEQNAPDAWQDDFALLWPVLLKDPDSGFKEFVDAKGVKRIGILDSITGKWVKVSSHFFRNTFAVACRLKGMSWDRIGELIGDDAKTVEEHYGPYTVDMQEAIHEDVKKTWPVENLEADNELRVRHPSSSVVGRVAQA